MQTNTLNRSLSTITIGKDTMLPLDLNNQFFNVSPPSETGTVKGLNLIDQQQFQSNTIKQKILKLFCCR